ncbi:hypothetical protein NUSPORA_01000 [Nucleospora cyclopteri]
MYKFNIKMSIYISIILLAIIELYELYFKTFELYYHSKGKIYVPKQSYSYSLIIKDKSYFKESIAECKVVISSIISQVIRLLIYFYFALFTFNTEYFKKIENILNTNFCIITLEKYGNKKSDINIIFFLCVSSLFFDFKNFVIRKNIDFSLESMVFMLLQCFIISFAISLHILFLRKFGKKYIMSWFFASIFTLITLMYLGELVPHLKDYKKVNSNQFTSTVQKQLKKYDLFDSVYELTLTDSMSFNAALVGLNNNYIVIHNNQNYYIDNDKLSAIMLHEIGHYSYDHLMKFFIMHLTIFLIYLIIAIFMYQKKFDYMSKPLSFSLMFILFYLTTFNFLKMIENLLRHHQEYSADEFAGSFGVNKVLSKALYEISNKKSFLHHNQLYGLLHYTHPCIYNRMEKLNK